MPTELLGQWGNNTPKGPGSRPRRGTPRPVNPNKGTGRGRKRKPPPVDPNVAILEAHYQETLWASRSERDIREEMERRLAAYFARRPRRQKFA